MFVKGICEKKRLFRKMVVTINYLTFQIWNGRSHKNSSTVLLKTSIPVFVIAESRLETASTLLS